MKEIASYSPLVGTIVTCEWCNRSFIVEAGDPVLPAYKRVSAKRREERPKRVDLPCGHYWAVPELPTTNDPA